MKARRAKDLGQLSDADFFRAVSEGLSLVVENATKLHEASQTLLKAKHAQGMHVLDLLAAEEAAKFLILIDAVRCPRRPARMRARQLGYFHDHLARGIYADLCLAAPAKFAELERYAESQREMLYLDGPNAVDWIFRNRILAEREEAIYVDYVESDNGHQWVAPRNDEMLMDLHMAPRALTISHALHKTGMTTSEGLAVIAKIWRRVKVHPDLHWDKVEAQNKETLDELGRNGLLNPNSGDAYRFVVQHWQFPLYTLDLSPKKIDRKGLEKIQRGWIPDY